MVDLENLLPDACVLAGGSGSTGSSLLRTILNRHDAMFSGEELNFFNKRQFFVEWQTSKRQIFNRTPWTIPRTDGWFEYSGTALTHPDYLWTEDEVRELVSKSDSLFDFTNQFFERPLRENKKSIWLEKTPSNCYCFTDFLAAFPFGKVIHTARNPYEAVGSLVRRGMSPYFASASWIYNTCAALSARQSPRYLLIRYEDLTEYPSREIGDVCKFLDIESQSSLLMPSKLDSSDHPANQGWRFSRNQEIANPAPAFEKMDKRIRKEIYWYLSILRVSDNHAKKLAMTETCCKEACSHLGYDYKDLSERPTRSINAWRQQLQNNLWRTIRCSPTRLRNFPIEIKSH